MDRRTPMVTCPNCKTMTPAGTDLCPKCKTQMPMKLGYLSDDQIKRVKKPLSITAWVVLAIIVIVRFLFR